MNFVAVNPNGTIYAANSMQEILEWRQPSGFAGPQGAEFESFLLDDLFEWSEMHNKIVEVRTAKKLTISEFLICCGLNPNRPYFRQLASMNYQRIPPSKKGRSPGREFRDAVNKYFECKIPPQIPPPQPLETLLLDWCEDHRLELQLWHISDLRLLEPESTKLVVFAYKQCQLTNESIVTILMSDVKIRAAFPEGSSFSMVLRRECQLLSLVSPVCIKAEDLGTATLVNVNGCIVALTSAHVVNKKVGDVVVARSSGSKVLL